MTKGGPKRHFLSFVEECVMNPRYAGYIGGRMEIFDNEGDSQYAMDEDRYFTKDVGFYKFRDKWDFKNVGPRTLDRIRCELKEKYLDSI